MKTDYLATCLFCAKVRNYLLYLEDLKIKNSFFVP